MWLPIIFIVGLFGAFKGTQKFESPESKNQHAMYEARLAAGEDRATDELMQMERLHNMDAADGDAAIESFHRIPIQK